MRFRIVEVNKSPKFKYEIFYLDEYAKSGPAWKKVIWDSESVCNFCDKNYVETVGEAEVKAQIFKEDYEKKHGKIIDEFTL